MSKTAKTDEFIYSCFYLRAEQTPQHLDVFSGCSKNKKQKKFYIVMMDFQRLQDTLSDVTYCMSIKIYIIYISFGLIA